MHGKPFFLPGKQLPLFLMAALLLVAVAGQSAMARELWVDHGSLGGACSDSRAASAVTKTTPLCTLGAAANMVAPGDVVRVRGGTYTEAHNCSTCDGTAILQLVTAGTSSQWIRFAAEPNETVILQGGSSGPVNGLRVVVAGSTVPSFNEVSGFNVRNLSKTCIFVNNVPDIRLANMEATGCGVGAVELHSAQRVTLQGSRIHDNNTTGWTSAIDLYECKDGNVIRGNLVWSNSDTPGGGNPDSEGHGLTMDYCQAAGGALIENNVIWNNEGWCMAIYRSDGATIRNNTCYRNGTRADGSGEISHLGNRGSIYNNILAPRPGVLALNMRYNHPYVVDTATLQENFNLIGAQPGDVAFAWAGSSGTLAQYQANNPRGWGAASRVGDPLFVSSSNFHLTANSPARDTGDNLHAALTDADGNARPFNAIVDRGAYEFGAVGTRLDPPTNLRVISP